MKPFDVQPWLKRAEKRAWLAGIRPPQGAAARRPLAAGVADGKRSVRSQTSSPTPTCCMIQQEPLRARVLLKSGIVVLSLFIMWAAVAQVDEITRGDGKVIPSRQLQVLQSLDGGIVSEILVQEGQVVRGRARCC